MEELMFNRIFAAAAVGSMMIAAPAVAGDDKPTISVVYSDLNLNTEAGQAALEHRVMAATKAVCGADDVRTGTRLRSTSERKCLAEAKKSAKQQVAAIIEDARRGG